MDHSVHFVKSSGNDSSCGGTGDTNISSPGMAYNIFSVGAIDDRNTTNRSDDVYAGYSSFKRSEGAYKPDVSAPGTNISFDDIINGGDDGTSFAAPMVTGLIAQMIESNPSLATLQDLMKAIVPVAAIHKTATDYGSYSSYFAPFYSDREGAGMIDASDTQYVISSGNFKSLKLSSFPYQKSIYIPSGTTKTRIAIAWLKQNRSSDWGHDEVSANPALSDLDLRVYDPYGNEVATSRSGPNNVEIVEFVPQYKGKYYKVKIEGFSVKNSSEYVGLAWW